MSAYSWWTAVPGPVPCRGDLSIAAGFVLVASVALLTGAFLVSLFRLRGFGALRGTA